MNDKVRILETHVLSSAVISQCDRPDAWCAPCSTTVVQQANVACVKQLHKTTGWCCAAGRVEHVNKACMDIRTRFTAQHADHGKCHKGTQSLTHQSEALNQGVVSQGHRPLRLAVLELPSPNAL